MQYVHVYVMTHGRNITYMYSWNNEPASSSALNMYIHLLAFAFVIIDMTVIVIMHDKFIIACTLDVYFRIVVVPIDIVSSQLYVCHILVSKKCQLQAGTIHPRPLA